MGTQKTTETFLIVNADDFGESKEVNDGIIEAHRNGIVTSASLLTNLSGYEHAISCIQTTPTLDIGIHLNVYRETPLTQCLHLTRSGKFFSNTLIFVFRCYTNKKCVQAEIRQEFEAQIQKAIASGITISHLDTDKHLHTLPFIFETLLFAAEKYNIPSVRLPYESFSLLTFFNPSQLYKNIIMGIFAPYNIYLLQKSTRRSPHHFYGVSFSKKFTVEHLKKFLTTLKPGVTELS